MKKHEINTLKYTLGIQFNQIFTPKASFGGKVWFKQENICIEFSIQWFKMQKTNFPCLNLIPSVYLELDLEQNLFSLKTSFGRKCSIKSSYN